MNTWVVGQLIRKDWRLHRVLIFASIFAGVVALAIVQFATESTMVLGAVWFFISMIMVGTMLPIAIVNERKKQNLAFLMSLPISSIQYTTSKLLSGTGMFLIPWLTLLGAALLLIEVRGIFPHGVIPLLLIIALMPFVGFCIITAAALIGESEGWGIAANVACNSSYGLAYYFLTRVPGVMAHNASAVVVWSPATLKILVTELALIPLLLGMTYLVQSRKRDFV
jgi:ABC-2 type transport system permease protein